MAKRLGALLAVGLVTGALLTGCVPSKPMPTPTTTPSVTPSATPTAVAPPTLKPDGTAAQNRKYFDFVNETFFGVNGYAAVGVDIINNLVNSGFAKENMEITPDETSVGLRADTIVFSVRIGDGCLIGQFSDAGYHSELGPTLGTGKCLVGQTRPIDW